MRSQLHTLGQLHSFAQRHTFAQLHTSAQLLQPFLVVKLSIGPVRCPRTTRTLSKRSALSSPNSSHSVIYWSHLPYLRGQNVLNFGEPFTGIIAKRMNKGVMICQAWPSLSRRKPPGLRPRWRREGSSSIQHSVSVRVWS